ncbi:MAG: hypothetical protein AB7U98_01340 [Candidatus Nitrosocosmicus sp.]
MIGLKVTTNPHSFLLSITVITGIVMLLTYDSSSLLVNAATPDRNMTDSLELALNNSRTNGNSGGIICVPVPDSYTSYDGYQCEPCDLFPGLCDDILSRNNTIPS